MVAAVSQKVLNNFISMTQSCIRNVSEQYMIQCISNVSAMFTPSVHKNRVTLRGASIVASRVASMPLETYEDSIEGKKKKKSSLYQLHGYQIGNKNVGRKGPMGEIFCLGFYSICSRNFIYQFMKKIQDDEFLKSLLLKYIIGTERERNCQRMNFSQHHTLEQPR